MIDFIKNNFHVHNKKKLILFIMFNIGNLLMDVVIAYLNGGFVDLIVGKSKINIVMRYSILVIISFTLSVILAYGYQVISSTFREELCFELSSKVIKHIQKMPVLEIKKYDPSYLTQRIYSDSADIVNFTLDNAIIFFVNILIFLMLLLYVGRTNVKIFVVFTCYLPLYILIYFKSKNKLVSKTKEVKESQDLFYQKMYEQISLSEHIKIEGEFKNSYFYLRTAYFKYIGYFKKYIKFNIGIKSIETFTSYSFYAILLVLGAIEIINGNLTIGGFTVINAYFNRAIGIVTYYLQVGQGIKQTEVSVTRMKELFAIKEEYNGKDSIQEINEIVLENLTYKYPEGKNNIFDNFSFRFSRGKIYVIKGANGVGKSTLFNLMIGMLDSEGRVSINGKKIYDIDMYKLRKQKIAVVCQKIQFPYDTIGTLLDIRENDVRNSSNLVKSLFFNEKYNILKLGNKYPDELSGGELQKIYLYRAITKDSDIIFLDEPTSAMDIYSSKKVYTLLEKMKSNKIIIIITHNREFENIADEIIELKDASL